MAAISFPESSFPLTSGRKTRDSLVFRPLVKGNEDSGNEIDMAAKHSKCLYDKNEIEGVVCTANLEHLLWAL